MPEVISGSLLLVGCLIFAMGWLNRAQSFLAYYGALLIGWALVLSRLWVSDMPWPNASSEFLLAILASFVTLAAVQFLLRYGGERRRWVDVGLPAQCAVMPLTLMVMGPHHLHAMATFWYVVLARRGAAPRRCCTCASCGCSGARSSGRWPRSVR